MAAPAHVVFGAGPLGRAVVEELVRQGEPVRWINRSGRMPETPPGVETAAADVRSADAAKAAAAGARVVYNCTNTAYTTRAFQTEQPVLWGNILTAAEAARARLVFADNLYPIEEPPGLITEDRTPAPTTRKGKARAALVATMLDAHRAGRVEVALGRGANYFGPWADAQSHLGGRVFRPLLQGKPVRVIGRVDLPHTLTYTPDFGRALVTLGQHDRAFGRAWHVPNAPTRTRREVLEQAAALAGEPLRVRTMGPLGVRALGVVVPVLREFAEMMYEFERPSIVDSAPFTEAFGVHATPFDESLPATLDWFRRHP